MLTDFEWFQNAVTGLSDDSRRIELLSEMKIAIGALNKSQLQLVAHSLRLNDVFDCLNSSEKEQIELTSDVLSALLSSLDLGVVLNQYNAWLLRAIGHPAVKVKEMVIKELLNGTTGDDTISRLCQEVNLLVSVVDCISQDDMSVANSAILLLVKIGKTSTGRLVILSEPIINVLRRAMLHNDLTRFRVYELVVEIAVDSPEGLAASQNTGVMSSLLAELNSKDVMLQLNTMELLTKLVLCTHGLHFLEQQGTLNALVNRLATINGDAMETLLLPGLIKFFGNVAQCRPKDTFSRYPSVITAIFDTIDNDDLVLRGVAMETIGYIATTVEGKTMLFDLGEPMFQTVGKLGIYSSTLPTEMRVRALNSIANLLQLKLMHQNPQTLLITRMWFDQLAHNSIELLMHVCKQPFPELRLAGLQVLLALVNQPWGQEQVNITPGLIEYLLDRSLEPNKLCKDAKYEVVQTLSVSPSAEVVLSESTLVRLREFVSQGPFFVRAQTEVAIESAS